MNPTSEMLVRFDPLDTLFFRDGSAWDKGVSDQSDVASQFPPSPATLIGALRAAGARALGWSGGCDWSDAIKKQLGDGKDLGGLRFRGPVLLHGDELLFPAPAHLLLNESQSQTRLLQPGAPRRCDLGEAVRLPTLTATTSNDRWRSADTYCIDAAGMQWLLHGAAPETTSLTPAAQLWQHESRVGIERNAQTRTTEEGALYSPRHIRLAADVGLGLWSSGLPEEVLSDVAATPQPLGGESRTAWLSAPDAVPSWPSAPSEYAQDTGGLNYSVVVLSSLPLTEAPAPGATVAGFPGALVSACLPRVQMLGGWNSVRHTPLPLKPHLAPGSVLFMHAPIPDENTVRALHGACVGPRADWGFGLVAIGTWS